MSIRVLVADDSEIAAELIRRTLELAPDLTVVGVLDGIEALIAAAPRLSPDVILLDLWMPGRMGLGAIRELSALAPIIVVSDIPTGSPVAVEALAQGARGFVAKSELGDADGGAELRRLVRECAATTSRFAHPVVAVVGSTGAMDAYKRFVPEVASLPAAFVFLQHVPAGREESFAQWITSLGLPTKVARRGDLLRKGRGFVAGANSHTVFDADRQRLNRQLGEPVEGHRPSGTVLLRSAVVFGDRLIAVILSGMGTDGAQAASEVIAASGQCIAQAPEDCVVATMPQAAIDASRRVRSTPVDHLAVQIGRAVRSAAGAR